MSRQAENRLQANTSDGLAIASSSSSTYLGNPVVTTQLVRDFFALVFSARAKFQGSGRGVAATNEINNACKEFGQRFFGEDDKYAPMPWNSPHRLGNFLRATVENVGEYDSPCEAYFHFLAMQALSAAVSLEEGQMTEDQVKAGISAVIDDAVSVLMGTRKGDQQ